MAKINQELISALMAKLGVKRTRVYSLISKIANSRFLENDLAALVLAQESGLNPKKFSSPQQRAQIRADNISSTAAAPAVLPVPRKINSTGGTKAAKPRDGKSVFVVHGRNETLRKELFVFLRSLGLHPLEWSTAIAQAKKGANPNVEAIIDACMAKVQAVVVLFSPDEEVRLVKSLRSARDGDNFELQPRPNVIFEAGLALGRHPEKTVLVEIGEVRGFSDIAGRHMARLDGTAKSRHDFVGRLEILKCSIDRSGSDWLTEGNFSV